MTDALTMTVYAAAKFLAYSGWCALGLRLTRPGAVSVVASLRLGAVRWCIGLAFGIAVFFFVGSIDAPAAARTYFLVYSPVRAVEWGIMAWLITRRLQQPSLTLSSAVFWCAGGMLVSFLTDLLSPEGLQGRFCIGRCLC
jgi:hypothetical protein